MLILKSLCILFVFVSINNSVSVSNFKAFPFFKKGHMGRGTQ
jgi:hypothetical protein